MVKNDAGRDESVESPRMLPEKDPVERAGRQLRESLIGVAIANDLEAGAAALIRPSVKTIVASGQAKTARCDRTV